jgi:NNP family nitrate/nitrite transporter-like MFS transporter
MAYTIKGNPKQGLAGATFGFLIGFAAVSLFGPTAGFLKEMLGLTAFQVSWLVAAPALSGSLLRIPFSAWVDTTGGRKPFLVLLGISILGMMGLLGVVSQLESIQHMSGLYPLLLGLGVCVGCGIATFSVGIGQVSYWFPQTGQGQALGTYAGLGNLAPGAISFVLPYALTELGLPGTYLAWLACLVGGTGMYFLSGRNAWYFQLREQGASPEEARKIAEETHGQELFPSGNAVQGLKVSAGIWKTWALVSVYFTTFGGFIALTSWLPTYWTEFHGVAATTAGSLTALYSIGASLIRVPGGAISDRIGGETTLMVSLIMMGAGAVVMTLSGEFYLSVAGEVLLAAGMGVANAAVFKLVPQEIPQAVGGAAGWVGGLGAFGGFAIPPMMAVFVARSGEAGYSQGFGVFVVLAILSLGVAIYIRHAHTR